MTQESTLHPVAMAVRKNLTQLNIPADASLLAGVSGGMDSMVMAHILHTLGYRVSVAHVNFNLRGPESLNDSLFVRKWCMDHGLPFYELSKDTGKYAAEAKQSIQVAAREIRYDWWEELVRHHEFDFVATAHHLDDSIETMLMNLMRGTGLKGVTGIPRRRDYYIRPLLDSGREQIRSYAEAFHIPFRTDASNETDHYQRNRVRHHLVPMLEELQPGFHAGMRHTLHRLNLEWDAWTDAYLEWNTRHVSSLQHGFLITGKEQHLAFKLRWLEEKGVPWLLAYDFLTAPHGESGKALTYKDFKLTRTADGHFVETSPPAIRILIPHEGKFLLGDIEFSIERVDAKNYQPEPTPWVEYINEDVVHWPLEIRTIEKGERFQPLGMSGKTKKLQDFLVDEKLEMFEKGHQLLLTNREHILWIIGRRLDERARIKSSDKQVYRIRFDTYA